MAIDCDDIPVNGTYSCDVPWGSGCVSRDGFQLDSLWKYTQSIHAACPGDKRLFNRYGSFASVLDVSLSQASCENIAGKGWTHYPTSDIWNRLTMWVRRLALFVA